MLENGRIHSKTYTRSTFEEAIKETCKYIGIEDSHDMGRKNEK